MLHGLIRKSIILALAVVLLASCQLDQKKESPVLLRVDGREVTLEQFREGFTRSLPPGQKLTEEEREELERSYLVKVIDRELALAQADRLGIVVQPDELQLAIDEARQEFPQGSFETMLREHGTTLKEWSANLHQELLMEKIVRHAVYSRVAASEEEIAQYYKEHKDTFNRPDQVRARQIVVPTEEEGQEILGLLRQGEPFAEVAEKHSMSPDADQGGDLGYFARGEMPPEFDEVVFKLAVGRLSDLVKSEYGYHVFLVEDKRKAQQMKLDDVRDKVRERVIAAKEENAYQDWLRDLRSRAMIEMDWSLL